MKNFASISLYCLTLSGAFVLAACSGGGSSSNSNARPGYGAYGTNGQYGQTTNCSPNNTAAYSNPNDPCNPNNPNSLLNRNNPNSPLNPSSPNYNPNWNPYATNNAIPNSINGVPGQPLNQQSQNGFQPQSGPYNQNGINSNPNGPYNPNGPVGNQNQMQQQQNGPAVGAMSLSTIDIQRGVIVNRAFKLGMGEGVGYVEENVVTDTCDLGVKGNGEVRARRLFGSPSADDFEVRFDAQGIMSVRVVYGDTVMSSRRPIQYQLDGGSSTLIVPNGFTVAGVAGSNYKRMVLKNAREKAEESDSVMADTLGLKEKNRAMSLAGAFGGGIVNGSAGFDANYSGGANGQVMSSQISNMANPPLDQNNYVAINFLPGFTMNVLTPMINRQHVLSLSIDDASYNGTSAILAGNGPCQLASSASHYMKVQFVPSVQ